MDMVIGLPWSDVLHAHCHTAYLPFYLCKLETDSIAKSAHLSSFISRPSVTLVQCEIEMLKRSKKQWPVLTRKLARGEKFLAQSDSSPMHLPILTPLHILRLTITRIRISELRKRQPTQQIHRLLRRRHLRIP